MKYEHMARKKNEKIKAKGGDRWKGRERSVKEGEKRGVEKEKFLSKIYGIWIVGFRRSKR